MLCSCPTSRSAVVLSKRAVDLAQSPGQGWRQQLSKRGSQAVVQCLVITSAMDH